MIVFERQISATISQVQFQIEVGPQTVQGLADGFGFMYSLGISSPSGAVLSSAGISDTDGAFPVLFGAVPFISGQMSLAMAKDGFDKSHGAERVAFAAFGLSRGRRN